MNFNDFPHKTNKKIRILEINKAYYPHVGGIESLMRQYSERLSETDNTETEVLVCRENFGKTYSERINGIHVVRAGSLGTYFSCPVSLSFIKLFKKMSESADTVHIHFPFPLADTALLLSGYKGRVVISWHSDIVRQKRLMFFYKPIMKKLLNRADCIITATQGHISGSDFLPEYRDKCVVIPYGINPGEYLSIKRAPILTEKCTYNGSVKVFFTGRLVYYKGVEVLIRAFTKLKNCELFISGTGVLESKLKEMTKKYNIGDIVHFLGFLPDEQLKQAYADCDIFVLPSSAKSEAFGIVQLEAMVYGKPVINTRLDSGVPYVSIHGRTGFTVAPSNPAQLAKAIDILAKNKKLREKFGKNAAMRVKNNFSEKDVIQKLRDVLEDDGGDI
ncbi:MAG: glycosyltransferase [Ruminococcus sp.]|nr:glycosyltransferase [Ruminococcus sp.]